MGSEAFWASQAWKEASWQARVEVLEAKKKLERVHIMKFKHWLKEQLLISNLDKETPWAQKAWEESFSQAKHILKEEVKAAKELRKNSR